LSIFSAVRRSAFFLAFASIACAGCADDSKPAPVDSAQPSANAAPSASAPLSPADAGADAAIDAPRDAAVTTPEDVGELQKTTQEELLALVEVAPGRKWRKRDPGEFLRRYIGPRGRDKRIKATRRSRGTPFHDEHASRACAA
jgi:hypothetical protein